MKTPIEVLEEEALESLVIETIYHSFPGRVVCCLVLESGFSVIGVSCHIGTDTVKMGMASALADARKKLWEMDAYMTMEALSRDDSAGIEN